MQLIIIPVLRIWLDEALIVSDNSGTLHLPKINIEKNEEKGVVGW